MILKKKFEIPEKKEKIIVKPQLEHLFETAATSCVIVKAMSGYGKTAVFAKAAGKHKDMVRWYTLDVTDNDSECFLSCLESIWETVDEERGKAVMEDDVQSRLLALIQRAQKWQGNMHIVLDNLQVISSKEVLQLLLFLQQYTEEKLSFILLTNDRIPKGFLPLLLKGKGIILSENELRLTPDEVWQHMGNSTGLAREVVNQVTKDLCGWPLGVRHVLEYLCSSGCGMADMQESMYINKKDGKLHWNRILQESMLSGCLDEILWDKCSGDLQVFLCQTAVLDRFSWEMCHVMFAGQFTRQTFEDATSCHGILYCFSEAVDTYEYGRAFGSYLSAKLSDGEKRGIYLKAARWYGKKKDFLRLADYAILGREDYFLLITIEQFGRELLCQKNQKALGIMIEYLEKNTVLLLPEVSGIVAQYFYSQGNFNKMEGYLNAADSSFGKDNKYACYRSLYRALIKLDEDKEKYEKQVHNALFFLKESDTGLPYLKDKEEEKLKKLTGKKKQEALKVCAFGVFQVLALQDGRELAWRTKKGRELFAYLLDIEGKAVERRQLIELLWQDEIPENAVAMLHNMIYNIRKELSAYRLETILIYENRKYRLSTEKIACDFFHIKEIARLVEEKNEAGLRREHKSFLKYWGSYLEDIDSFWAEEKRAYYDEIFKKGCWMLAEQFVKENSYETALTLYKNILSIDPYSEEVVEKILLLYGEQKKWEKVKQCYSDFEKILKKDLGITPGEEVLAAYHSYL